MLDFPINFKNININFFSISIGIYLVVLGIIYYIIFHKHHKRNKIEFSELITLVTKFYSITILSTILIIIGIYVIILADYYKEDRNQVIISLILGIIIISATIINYIFYIKRNLKDLDPEIREKEKKNNIKIGEILELIFFTIFIFTPIWRIPEFMNLTEDKKRLVIEIIKSFLLCIASLFVLFSLNPLDIKGKLHKKK